MILTDMGRVFLSQIEDTSGAHDLLVGGSTPASTLAAFGESPENVAQVVGSIANGFAYIPLA